MCAVYGELVIIDKLGGVRCFNPQDLEAEAQPASNRFPINLAEYGTHILRFYPCSNSAVAVATTDTHLSLVAAYATGTLAQVPSLPSAASHFLWDLNFDGVFYAISATSDYYCVTPLVHLRQTLSGSPSVRVLSEALSQTGAIIPAKSSILYATDGQLVTFNGETQSTTRHQILNTLSLEVLYLTGKTELLLQAISANPRHPGISAVLELAYQALDLETASQILHHSKDTLLARHFIKCCAIQEEELAILRGHVLVWHQNYAGGQEMYLSSTEPEQALCMRSDLRQWEQALALARQISSFDEARIAMDYANQLETDGRYSDALAIYNAAHECAKASIESSSRQKKAHYGQLRMRLRLGELKAVECALSQIDDAQFISSCASILHEMHDYANAGNLHLQAGNIDSAAKMYLLGNAFDKASTLMRQVTDKSLHHSYAKTLEARGQLDEALAHYRASDDVPSMVSINLRLTRVDEALQLARTSKSAEAARYVVSFLMSMGDSRTVLEFYIIAGQKRQAAQHAKEHGVVAEYIELMRKAGEQISTDELMDAAKYCEAQGKLIEAAELFAQADQPDKAFRFFVEGAKVERDESRVAKAIEGAIHVVAKTREESYIHELIALLMARQPRNPKNIFKLHMHIGDFQEAVQTAQAIAREDMTAGNYKEARDNLYEMCGHLERAAKHVPMKLNGLLMLLHSYTLVKVRNLRSPTFKVNFFTCMLTAQSAFRADRLEAR
jgi:WD repeat-containing protein 19